jgi:catechol 2,3-dioxygenase-like lactoylglutathione lyase family enzyme
MLAAARYTAAIPCSDLKRARSFYADKLGLTPAQERPDRLF